MRYLMFFILILVFIGCGTDSVKPVMKEKVVQTPKSNNPSWLLAANEDNATVCGVGEGKVQSYGGLKMQKRVAYATAKADIGRQIKLYVSSQLDATQKCVGNECSDSVSLISKQQSSLMLRNMRKTNEWIDPETKNYYVRLCTPKRLQ